MYFSVVLATYNRASVLKRTLESLAKLDFPRRQWELIIVNNNSTDNTAQVITDFIKRYPGLAARAMKEMKQGKTFAGNTGIRRAKYDHIVFVDDDIEVNKGLLKRFAELYRRYPQAVVIGGRINIKIEGVPATETNKLMAPELEWILGGVDYGKTTRALTLGESVLSGNMSFNRGQYKHIFMRPELGRSFRGHYIYGDDYELCIRLILKGKQVIYSADVTTVNVSEASRLTWKYVWRRSIFAGVERYVIDSLFKNKKPYRVFKLWPELKRVAKTFFSWDTSLRWQLQRLTNLVAFTIGYYVLGSVYCGKSRWSFLFSWL